MIEIDLKLDYAQIEKVSGAKSKKEILRVIGDIIANLPNPEMTIEMSSINTLHPTHDYTVSQYQGTRMKVRIQEW